MLDEPRIEARAKGTSRKPSSVPSWEMIDPIVVSVPSSSRATKTCPEPANSIEPTELPASILPPVRCGPSDPEARPYS